MPDPKTALENLIEEHGGVLIRDKRHYVFEFPNGQRYTIPKTPSCTHSYANSAAALRTLLGTHSPDRGAPGQRREKRLKRKPVVVEGKMLPSATLETKEWRDKLAEVKPVLPPRPVAKQRAPSSSKITRQTKVPAVVVASIPKPKVVIKHPVHHSRPTVSTTRPPVAIDGLLQKFGARQ
jgi:hypothetical protein